VKEGVADVLEDAVYWNEMYDDDIPDVVLRPVDAVWLTDAAAQVGLHSCSEPVEGSETIVADTVPASMSCTYVRNVVV
jgi:hypothetical protein